MSNFNMLRMWIYMIHSVRIFPSVRLCSLSMCNLMLLAYETLKDAQNGSQEGSFHLCNSLYNMFELYCDVAPSYHKDKIVSQPLPAGTALINLVNL